MTSRRTGVSATTVAVRGDSVSSAISPKKSPVSNVATRRPFRRASTVPSMSTKNSRPFTPSVISSEPAGWWSSSPSAEIWPSSLVVQLEKSGTARRSSTLALRRSFTRSILRDRGSGDEQSALDDAAGAAADPDPRPPAGPDEAGDQQVIRPDVAADNDQDD